MEELLLSKKHSCYKVHTLLMKSSDNSFSFMDILSLWITLYFYKKILIPPSVFFFKNVNPL